jgi:ASC-1-like (ASCH) protein
MHMCQFIYGEFFFFKMEQDRQITDIHLDDPWFDYVANGAKTIEGKLSKGKSLLLSSGSCVVFHGNGGAFVRTKVTDIRKYGSIREYLETEGLARTLPGIETIDEGIAVYAKYYKPGLDVELGVLALELVLI